MSSKPGKFCGQLQPAKGEQVLVATDELSSFNPSESSEPITIVWQLLVQYESLEFGLGYALCQAQLVLQEVRTRMKASKFQKSS